MTNQDKIEFLAYCRACTDNQLREVYKKERAAWRNEYAEIAAIAMEERGIL